ncbi:MAG TPA: hypothetical protein RMH99_17740, partial [Sandaracinaceae bacterium LLY-WYZ-13_1]|nr:hypothetical protein [Sandaracinaceae bacterium LLY-WYZ-13_1]
PAPPPPDRPRSTASMPPPVSAAAPPGCPDDAVEDPPGFVRPAVWELLRLRTQELRDRLPQLSRDGSPALRQGLRGLNGDDPTRAAERIAEAPDHVRDGFDVSVAALLLLGMRAIGDEDPRAAWHHARIAAGRAPDDPLPHALASLAADRMDDPENARREMGWAVEAAPDEPALALVHARQLAEVARYDQAVPALDRYLAAVPEDARVRS